MDGRHPPLFTCLTSRGRSLSIVESNGVNRSMCTPSHSVVSIGKYSKWSWNGVFSFLLQVAMFLRLKRIIPALRHALRHTCNAQV